MTILTETTPVLEPEVEPLPAESDQIADPAGVLGMMSGMAILASLMLGIMMPVIFWVLAGALGVFTIGCAAFSRSRLKWWCLLFGVMGMIPPAIFILVESIPSMQR